MKNNNWTHIYELKDIPVNNFPNKTNTDKSNKLFDTTDQIINKTNSKLHDFNKHRHNSHIGISSLTIATTALVTALILSICHVYKGSYKPNPIIGKQIENEILELKLHNNELADKIKTILNNELREHELEIENRLTNKIKHEILESIIMKRKTENNEEY